MASVLGDTTCAIHPDRQSSARCPSCGSYFCSECITEHEGRLTCASCLAADSTKPTATKAKWRFPFAATLQVIVALILCWAVYYSIGRTLADIPDEFHDGTIWE